MPGGSWTPGGPEYTTTTFSAGGYEVKVAPGTYNEADEVDLNSRNTTIRATGATISQAMANREVVHVHGTSQVVIEGGTFDGTGDGNNPVIAHDGAGGLRVQERPFVLMQQGGTLDLGSFETGVVASPNAS